MKRYRNRLKAAWAALRGRPVIYGCSFSTTAPIKVTQHHKPIGLIIGNRIVP